MSHSICNIVCGIEIPYLIRSYLDTVNKDYPIAGFNILYKSKGDTTAYSGIILDKFDECRTIFADDIIPKMKANESQMFQARRVIAHTIKLFKEILEEDDELNIHEKQKLIDSIPAIPKVILIWSSS